MDRMLAQANPMPTMESSSHSGWRMRKMDASPSAPRVRHRAWVTLRLVALAKSGRVKATSIATPLYTAKHTPTQLAPSL